MGGDGAEVIHSVYCGEGEKLALSVANQFKLLGQQLRQGDGAYYRVGDDKKDYYAVIRGTNMDAIITEFAFIDSSDVQIVDTKEELNEEAKAIAKGLCTFLGIAFKDIVPPVQDYENVLCRIIVDGVQVASLTGKTKCITWAKANCKGHVVVQSTIDGKTLFDERLGVTPPEPPAPDTATEEQEIIALMESLLAKTKAYFAKKKV